MKGIAIKYTKLELKWIKSNCQMTRKELHKAFCKRFKRNDISFDNLKSLCTRKGWGTGRTGNFTKGQGPWNKGKSFPSRGRSSETQFKKGSEPHNTNRLGHERISKDGYVEISVGVTNKHTGYKRSYMLKHRYLWEKKHGNVPSGMCLKSIDGNKANCDPKNWELINRSILPELARRDYDGASEEIKPAIMVVAKVNQALREAKQQ